jgi:hypothetical protein
MCNDFPELYVGAVLLIILLIEKEIMEKCIGKISFQTPLTDANVSVMFSVFSLNLLRERLSENLSSEL